MARPARAGKTRAVKRKYEGFDPLVELVRIYKLSTTSLGEQISILNTLSPYYAHKLKPVDSKGNANQVIEVIKPDWLDPALLEDDT